MNAPKFTAELKAKWIEALRSGKYDQTQLALKDDCGFCCLGVLCDVAQFESIAYDCIKASDDDEHCYVILDAGTQEALWTLNDEDMKSFPEIADHIEKYVPAEE